MKLVHTSINNIFEIKKNEINSLVVENGKQFRNLVEELLCQADGENGGFTISKNNIPIDFPQNVELICTIVPFDINRKTLLNRIISHLEKKTVEDDFYVDTINLLQHIEKYMDRLSEDFIGTFEYKKLNVASVIKSIGLEIYDEYDSLAEEIIDYMELVREFESKELFITINLRSFLDDDEMENFISTAISHEINLLMVENKDYTVLKNEKRFTIDYDLCEF